MSFSKLWGHTKPLIWNSLVASGRFAAADLTQQTLEKRPRYDFANTRRMMIVGSMFGSISYTWHRKIEAFIPGTSPRAVFVKTVLTVTIASSFLNGLFFTATSYLEGKDDIFAELKEKWPGTFKASLVYWPAINVGQFIFVPTIYRGLVANFFGYVWTVILCIVKRQGHEKFETHQEIR